MLLNEGEIDRVQMNKRNGVLYVGESVRESLPYRFAKEIVQQM